MRSLLVILLFVCATASAQTTFILVRHAEKETVGVTDPKDPQLSKEGQDRAQSLVRLLDKQKVDVILSTNFNRTKNTVKPLADAKGIAVTTYESLKEPELNQLKEAGGTVVICGHSNTIPAIANLLAGKDQFATFADSDYGNVLIVTVSEIGKGKVTHLRY
jgi:2,3-bisphosphoglycerate-dependent phosphoglycerate mutase